MPKIKKQSIKFRGRSLTKRQIDILSLLGQGFSNSEICEVLHLSSRTIECHIWNIKKVLSKDLDYRINDRRLVLLAKEMVDAFSHLFRSTKPQQVQAIS